MSLHSSSSVNGEGSTPKDPINCGKKNKRENKREKKSGRKGLMKEGLRKPTLHGMTMIHLMVQKRRLIF